MSTQVYDTKYPAGNGLNKKPITPTVSAGFLKGLGLTDLYVKFVQDGTLTSEDIDAIKTRLGLEDSGSGGGDNSALLAQLEALEATVEENHSDVDGSIQDIFGRLGNVDSTTDALQQLIIDLRDDVEVDVDALSSQVGQHTSSISALQGQIAALSYVPLQLNSYSVSPNVLEVGQTNVSGTLSWSFNKTVTALTITNVGSLSPSAVTSPVTINPGSTATFALAADDGTSYTGHGVSGSVSVAFQSRFYYGTSALTTLADADVIALANKPFATSRARSFTIAGAGQYIYFAYPASFGNASIAVNGLPNTAFTKTTRAFINSSGASVSYNIYRSDTIQNGSSLSITIS